MFIPGYESNLNMKYFEKSLQEIIYCSEKKSTYALTCRVHPSYVNTVDWSQRNACFWINYEKPYTVLGYRDCHQTLIFPVS